MYNANTGCFSHKYIQCAVLFVKGRLIDSIPIFVDDILISKWIIFVEDAICLILYWISHECNYLIGYLYIILTDTDTGFDTFNEYTK